MRDLTGLFSLDFDLAPTDHINEALVSRCLEVADTVRQKAIDAALAGPKEISENASKIEHLSHELAYTIGAYHRVLTEEWGPTDMNALRDDIRRKLLEESREFGQSLNDFVIRAQVALDDDGSRK